MSRLAADLSVKKVRPGALDFLGEHLNVQWLRPESALCDAIASERISRMPPRSPSLDLGCGNGLFSFITAQGKLSSAFDLYRNVDPSRFKQPKDLYDCPLGAVEPEWILREPAYRVDLGLDLKPNAVRFAEGLRFYRRCAVADAERQLPLREGSFETLFCNMPYWLSSPAAAFREIARLLREGGQAHLCFPDPLFLKHCASFRPTGPAEKLLKMLNRGRAASIRWTLSQPEWMDLARGNRFKVLGHWRYYSPLTLRVWDIGLRPISSLLIGMVQRLNPADFVQIKREWMETLRPLLTELLWLEGQDSSQGGFHFVCLKKSG